MAHEAVVAGVGMIPFTKPGKSDPYFKMGERAARAALADAGVDFGEIGQCYVGYVYGDSTCGQTALAPLGLTGVPTFNVNNNCASGSSAFFLAHQAVTNGIVDCALALGFEQMTPGALGSAFSDRPTPMASYFDKLVKVRGYDPNAAPMAQFFSGAAAQYIDKTGARPELFARISEKARRHAANNPYAVFRDPVTVEEVLASPTVHGLLTKLQCCPPTCGAAATVVCSEEFARRRGLSKAIAVKGIAFMGDTASCFEDDSLMKLLGTDVVATLARRVYEQAGVGPEDVDLCELHDCFTVNEVLVQEALGLAPPGGSEKFLADGDNSYGGAVVINPSGGLLSKGHPLGATGLAQITECVWQLRGEAGPRQVEGASVALQENAGMNGGCLVTLLTA
ncbi:MAG TPA: lipid-transfer protein [Nevskiaceae bacterium]|nr:lipid-transfer protein [Nevskiaceae bacterium]